MINFFTKTLSGTTYIISTIICVILILALIGVMSEIKYIDTIDETPRGTASNNNNQQLK